MPTDFIAHKFGGSSVADAACIERVANVLTSRPEPQVVVVSAMKGVTDALLNLARKAAERGEWRTDADALELRHKEAAKALLGPSATEVLARLDAEFRALHELLQAQSLVGAASNDLSELISGLGEVWSSLLVHGLLSSRGPVVWLDAREVVVVEPGELGAQVDWHRSAQNLSRQLPTLPRRVVTQGFIARTSSGRITTLGRNGSDYSGAIFAALFEAKELHLWSDVDGVLSADPKVVTEAVFIEELSYSEACELAYFGAKVIHPQTMAPAFTRGIPIIARNTFNPSHPGTRISTKSHAGPVVKGITTFSGLAILTIEGAGMLGVPGTAERAFAALKAASASVVMISQGSSEHSICCVIRQADVDAAVRAVRDAFDRELRAGQVTDVRADTQVAALAVVGDAMAGTPGVAARLFSALGRAKVNVRLIAQGASERNISVALDAADAKKALRAVHSAFYLSPQTLSVAVLGVGNVGQALLKQLSSAKERLLKVSNVDVRVRAVASSQTMLLGEQLEGLTDARAALKAGEPLDLAKLGAHVQADHLPHAVIIDCSGSPTAADHYAPWLEKGVHLITASKQAGAGPLERYQAIVKAARRASFRYETTVGAGLPVITTLRDLLDTGDQLLAVEGIFSGTLAYLFNRFDGSEPFSQLVRSAKQLGYTEPDPRDDLSGLDVARKLVILARERGTPAKLEAVQLESLVPEALRAVPLDEFMARLGELDAPMAARLSSAKKDGHVLRYVARLSEDGSAQVGLAALPLTHAFAHIRLTDNVVQFTTRRYRDNPLVVQGPGAGPEVTAAGVFADLLRVAVSLGAKL